MVTKAQYIGRGKEGRQWHKATWAHTRSDVVTSRMPASCRLS